MRSSPRLAVLALPLLVALAATSCSDDDDNGDVAVTATPPAAEATQPIASTEAPSATEPAGAPTSSGAIEVQGVVGAVDEAGRTIEFRPTGAEQRFNKIFVPQNAEIRTASGASIPLSSIRPSDRIIATGQVGDAPDVLISGEVTVQAVVPGAQPGG
jgi:hypothetical protein